METVFEKIDTSVKVGEFYRIVSRTAKELGIKVKKELSKKGYHLNSESKDVLEDDFSRVREHRAELNRECKKILETSFYHKWSIPKNREEFSVVHAEFTRLIEDDVLARAVFEKIKEMVKK